MELENQAWTSRNNQSAGTLWRDLILFYGLNFDLNEHIVCVRSDTVISRVEKKWKSRRIAVEGETNSIKLFL